MWFGPARVTCVPVSAMIRLALSDPRGLQRMGLESRRIATEEVSIDAMADAFVRALLLVTGGRGPGQEAGGR